MIGLEFVGAFAATSQLFGQLLKLVEVLLEIRDHINHFSARVQAYRERLESLARTIQYIHAHPPLLTHAVSALLQIISQRVSVLNDILHKTFARMPRRVSKKLMRLYTEKTAEQRIRELLEDLNSYKIDLVICLSGTRQMATGHVEAQKIAEDGSILLEGTSQHKELVPCSTTTAPRTDSSESTSSTETTEPIVVEEVESSTGDLQVKYDIYKDTELEDYESVVVGLAGGEQLNVPLRIEKTKCIRGKMIVVGRASQRTVDKMAERYSATTGP